MSRNENEVGPIPGLAPWVGGKRNAAGRIVARIAQVQHRCYAEPFIGMGGVFFRRPRRAEVEVVNDKNGEVVNLFRVVQRHAPAFLDELRFFVSSRAELARLWRLDPAALTDVERAARFFAIQRTNYGGKPDSRSFPASPFRGRATSAEAIRRYIDLAHRRLSTVTIEALDWRDLLARYDTPETLFYLDPPYHGVEHYYGRGLFQRDDFADLAARLARIKGKFILSINDVPAIRRLFKWARIGTLDVTYKVANNKRVTELLIEGRRR